MLDASVLIMSCEVACFLQKNVVANFFKLVFQSSWKKGRFSKDMRSTNSRAPYLRSWDLPWQGYKKASLRMEGSFQWNQPLTIWHIRRFVRKVLQLWWPRHLISPLTFERAVYKDDKQSIIIIFILHIMEMIFGALIQIPIWMKLAQLQITSWM